MLVDNKLSVGEKTLYFDTCIKITLPCFYRQKEGEGRQNDDDI